MNFTNLTNFINTLPSCGIPGADIIVYREGKELYRHSAGVKDTETGEKLSGNELYYMYSCTKVVTCLAALQLFEQGKFLMTDPISSVLPEFADVRVKNGAYTVPAARPITFRHLFTMTAGLNYNLTSAYIQDIAEKTGGRCPTRETIAAIAKIPLDFHPGDKFQYSLCHDVLAAAVEVMSGMKFGEYVKKNIFDPCGMKDSTFLMTDAVRARMAPQYRFNDKKNVPEKTPLSNMYILGTEYESGGAGLISSVNDYIKFTDALACGGVSYLGNRIISENTLKMMRSDCLTAEMRADYHVKWSGLIGYSYGFGVRCQPDLSYGIVASPSEFGWHGAAGSYMIIDPETRTSLFYGQHMLNNKERYVHPRIRHSFYSGM